MSYVIKATGEKQLFNENKIKRSLLEAGASKELTQQVLKQIKKSVYNNIPTEKILNLALKQLKKDKGTRARYDLKRSLMKLGPSGFPFEEYFALILQHKGYTTQVGQILKGKNITHEIDIQAKNKEGKFLIECKYHNKLGIHTRVKVGLYVYARFLDLKKHFNYPWVATNTKCTPDVINYAKGVNMRITSWDYPKEHSLRALITREHLYPITALKSISEKAKEQLFKSKIFLVKELTELDNKRFNELKRKTHFNNAYLKRIINEAKAIIQ